MARTASGLITQPSVEGIISDEAFNQLIQGLTTPPPGPTTNSISGTNISGRTSSGNIRKTERDPAAEAAMGDEATRKALLAIMADKLGVDGGAKSWNAWTLSSRAVFGVFRGDVHSGALSGHDPSVGESGGHF